MRQLWVSLDNSALRELAGSADLARLENEANKPARERRVVCCTGSDILVYPGNQLPGSFDRDKLLPPDGLSYFEGMPS